MSSIRILDEGTPKQRYQVTYEIKMLNGGRKRKSKTFPPKTPIGVIRKFQREQDVKYDRSSGIVVEGVNIQMVFEDYFLPLYEDQYSPSTIEGYKKAMYVEETGLVNYFQDTPLDKITVAMAQNYITMLKKKGLSPKTIKNKLLVLSALFERARKLQLVEASIPNPVSLCEFPRGKKERIEAYTPDELKKLLTLVKEKKNPVTTMIVFLASLAGLRRSEICGLKVDDIDFENNSIHVSRARIYGGEKNSYVVKGTKSDAGDRTIFCPTPLMDVLRMGAIRYKELQLRNGRQFKGEGFIVCYDDGSPISPNNVSSRYSRFVKDNEDKIRYLSLHKLRHTYASISLAATSGDVKSVQESLGHSSAKMTLDIYGHAYQERKVQQAKLLEKAVFSDII